MPTDFKGGEVALDAILMPGAYVGPGVELQSQAVIGPNASVLGRGEGHDLPAVVQLGARIGANATVCAGVTIGMRARVEPGAVVSRSVPPLAIVEGNPARIIGYVETRGESVVAVPSSRTPLSQTGVVDSAVRGVTLHHFRVVPDLRGSLTVGEFEREIPFVPKRYFLVFDVPTAETRGEHAHLRCAQFLIAVRGSVSVVADDGEAREEFTLDHPGIGLYLPPMTWGIQYRYSADAVLLVFASDFYDAADYVRDYGEFLEQVAARRAEG